MSEQDYYTEEEQTMLRAHFQAAQVIAHRAIIRAGIKIDSRIAYARDEINRWADDGGFWLRDDDNRVVSSQ